LKYKFFGLAILVFIAGCDLPTISPSDVNNFSVLCLLKTDSSYQEVQIYQTADLNKNEEKIIYQNADISLLNDNGIISKFIMYKRSGDRFYRSVNKVNLSADSIYHIAIQTESTKITGTTKFPKDFKIINYSNNQTIELIDNELNINVYWSKSINAYGYIVNVTYPIKFQIDSSNYEIYNGIRTLNTTDSNYSFQRIFNPPFSIGDSIKIEILAYDENYYKHLFDNYSIAGLDNAYGYFGAGVIKQLILRVIK